MEILKTLTLLVIISVGYADEFIEVISGDLRLEVSDYELSWLDAVQACQDRNARLLSISTAAKDHLIVDLFVNGGTDVNLPGNNSWISATELNTREGVWTWGNDEPLFYSRWFIGQPDDLDNLNCAYLAVQNLLYWRDANCSAPMYFVCESTL